MKIITLSLLMLSISHYSFAKDDQKFEARKAKMQERTQMKIEELGKHLECIKASTDHKSLKACRQNRKAERKQAKINRKANKKS